MKKSFLTLFVVFLSITSIAKADESACAEALGQHVDLISQTDELYEEMAAHAKDITSYEITQLQKTLTKRNQSLKALQALYSGGEAACAPKVVATAVAIYDYSTIGQTLIANTDLRRIVKGFIKFKDYQLTDLIKNYKKYTKNSLIEKTLEEIADDKVTLPEGVKFETSELDYDPHLYALSDTAIKGTTSVIAGAARVWGFISDRLKWRKGRLRKNMEARELMRSNLRPLDLVYETRNYTLSNLTIPGHWGHVGVWLGTKEELIALGVWDQDFFKPFRVQVEAGKNIVEIRKQGVNYQSLDTFINLDEIAITRVKNIQDRAESVYKELTTQITKKYDFKFDAHSADKITCAELIAFSYGDIPWPQTKTLFQYSLRPDDMGVITLDPNSAAEFVIFLKGNKDGSYENVGFEGWSKLFKLKNHFTPEQIKKEQEEENHQDSGKSVELAGA